jgi:hypothetical protein
MWMTISKLGLFFSLSLSLSLSEKTARCTNSIRGWKWEKSRCGYKGRENKSNY